MRHSLGRQGVRLRPSCTVGASWRGCLVGDLFVPIIGGLPWQTWRLGPPSHRPYQPAVISSATVMWKTPGASSMGTSPASG